MTMLRALYGLPYKVTMNGADASKSLVSYVEAYVIGKKYQIGELKTVAFNRIGMMLDSGWGNTDSGLWRAIRVALSQLPESDSRVRPRFIKHCVTHVGTLRKLDEFRTLLRGFQFE